MYLIYEMRDLLKLQAELPPQHSAGWHEARFDSATSSQFATYMQIYGDRKHALMLHANKIRIGPTFKMRWGTVMEDTSGFVFSYYTGLKYNELGSVAHEKYSRIRGSVDGWGMTLHNGVNEIWQLETKTPANAYPSDGIDNIGYYYQVIQNIEIIDASYGFFNNVKLLPCTTEDLHSIDGATDICHNFRTKTYYLRFNIAKLISHKKCYVVACNVYYVDPPAEGDTPIEHSEESYRDARSIPHIDKILERSSPLFNFGDLYCYDFNGNLHERGMLLYYETLFATFIMSARFKVVPFAACENENIQAWIDTLSIDDEAVGRLYVKVDAVNIERIERQKEFWENYLVPINMKWLQDLDDIKAGKEIEQPIYEKYPLPETGCPIGLMKRYASS